MATSYTSLLGFALPVTGELSGTWGDTVNDSITKLVEDAIAGVATASVASGDWTLTVTGSGAANQARCAILIPTGAPGVSRNIIAPSQSKAYIVINQSDAAVVLKGTATTGVTIPSGYKALVVWNGSDFVQIGASVAGSNTQVQYNSNGTFAGSANLTFDGTKLTVGGLNNTALTASKPVFTDASKNLVSTGTLGVDQGGTGATTLTLNNVILGNGTSAVQFVAPGTNGNVLTSNGTTWASAAAPSFSQVYPGAGIAVSTGSAWTTSKTSPSGDIVGTSDSQALTNKTISGASNTITVDGTNAVGFRIIPQVSKSAAYTLVLDDSGKHILHPSADTTARVFTIPANSSVPYTVGTALTFINQNGAGTVTISITSDTMRLAGAGTTGSRTLAANGIATAVKITSTEWIISGTGLT